MKRHQNPKILNLSLSQKATHSNTSIIAYKDNVQTLALETSQNLVITTSSTIQSIIKSSQFYPPNASPQSIPPVD